MDGFGQLSAGQDWAQEIYRGISKAQVLVYVASEHSAGSPWMEREFAAFIEKAETVIPIIIDDEGTKNLPLGLRRLQWVDFRGRFEPALRSLLNGISGLQGLGPIAAPDPQSKGYVFISYAAEDAGFVGELKAFLKGQGYAYWDFLESHRDYQADYTLELEDIIKGAKATLSVVSPDWKRSENALQELQFSKQVHTPVFLLRVRDPGPTILLSGKTFIDFTRERRNAFTRLDREMKLKGL
jgi:hypothetical protein